MHHALNLLCGIRHILWDWNGTLLDDAGICVCVTNGMLARRGLPALDDQRYQELFAFPVSDYYARLGFDFAKESFQEVGTEFIEQYQNEQLACELQADAGPALRAFAERGLSQSVLSASQQHRLDEQVSRLGVRKHFSEVLGIDDHYAAGKIALGRRWLDGCGLRRSEVLLIGDTDHDAQVAAELGVACVLLPRGHQSRNRLVACGVPVFASLREIADA